mmetsp:Transcript_5250/g.6876  ORF Transcript_5250/g.6876 Transcript_5250/m.6876 type:complete len:169 (+) Transcript_5250:86-592(+)
MVWNGLLRGVYSGRGRLLVVIDDADDISKSATEKYLRSMPPGPAVVASPDDLTKVRGECDSAVVFCSDVNKYFTFDMTLLSSCLDKLKPGGQMLAHVSGLATDEVAQLETTGLYAGAVESKLLGQVPNGNGCSQAGFACFKPSWADDTAAALPNAVRIDETAPPWSLA